MKKSVKTIIATTVVACLLSSASASFAQFGACEPTCATPSVEACAPSSDVLSCDVPYAPSCLPDGEYCSPYPNCYAGNCYGGVCSLVDDVARVAVAPFRWLAGAFTEGLYPDCGCAPRPPKTECNPCNICGDYVGGCNDGACGVNNYCAGSYGVGQSANVAEQVVYPAESYRSSGVYDVESYDSSPTRGSYDSANSFNLNNSFSQTLRNVFGTQRPANASLTNVQSSSFANVQPNAIRSVSYEQRPAQMQDLALSQSQRATPFSNATQLRELQNSQNVRFVPKAPETNVAPAVKTFGKTRAVK